ADRRPDISLVQNSRPVEAPRAYATQGGAALNQEVHYAAAEQPKAAAAKPQAEQKANIDIFDIPAFLRKQAD
ncbi:MAG TPA: cell division protein FtsZ, partial [Rheinheimera sp.]|nr:cell division protein FtsZ [Rheinheimera sp.]